MSFQWMVVNTPSCRGEMYRLVNKMWLLHKKLFILVMCKGDMMVCRLILFAWAY